MSRSYVVACMTELTPLCSQPCSVRFIIWCLRLAKLSAQGSDAARQRLHEVHDVLQRPGAAAALECCVSCLLQTAQRPLDIREFGCGSAYASVVELDVLAALGWLQAGDRDRALRRLGTYAAPTIVPTVFEAAAAWAAHLKEAGITLPYFEEAHDTADSDSWTLAVDEGNGLLN